MIEDLLHDVILGNDWFEQCAVVIDFKNRQVRCDTFSRPLRLKNINCKENDSGKNTVSDTAIIQIQKPIEIPARSQIVIPITIDSELPVGDYIFERSRVQQHKDLHLANEIISLTHTKQIPIRLLNVGERSIRLKSGLRIGRLTQLPMLTTTHIICENSDEKKTNTNFNGIEINQNSNEKIPKGNLKRKIIDCNSNEKIIGERRTGPETASGQDILYSHTEPETASGQKILYSHTEPETASGQDNRYDNRYTPNKPETASGTPILNSNKLNSNGEILNINSNGKITNTNFKGKILMTQAGNTPSNGKILIKKICNGKNISDFNETLSPMGKISESVQNNSETRSPKNLIYL